MQVLDFLIATMVALLLAPVVGVVVSQGLVGSGVFAPEAQSLVFGCTVVLLWGGLVAQRLLRSRSSRLALGSGVSGGYPLVDADPARQEWKLQHRSR